MTRGDPNPIDGYLNKNFQARRQYQDLTILRICGYITLNITTINLFQPSHSFTLSQLRQPDASASILIRERDYASLRIQEWFFWV